MQHHLRIAEHGKPGRCRFEAMRQPLDQRRADLLFHQPEPPAGRRQGEIHALRRAREVAMLADRHEEAQGRHVMAEHAGFRPAGEGSGLPATIPDCRA